MIKRRGLDYLIFEIEKEADYPDVMMGDFIIRSKDSKVVYLLRWLCGN